MAENGLGLRFRNLASTMWRNRLGDNWHRVAWFRLGTGCERRIGVLYCLECAPQKLLWEYGSRLRNEAFYNPNAVTVWIRRLLRNLRENRAPTRST